jgi:hypothetical protein
VKFRNSDAHSVCSFSVESSAIPPISEVGFIACGAFALLQRRIPWRKDGVYSMIPNCRLGRNHLPQVLASICSEVKLMRASFESLMTIPLTATFSC